jgi:hypothetical protein
MNNADLVEVDNSVYEYINHKGYKILFELMSKLKSFIRSYFNIFSNTVRFETRNFTGYTKDS